MMIKKFILILLTFFLLFNMRLALSEQQTSFTVGVVPQFETRRLHKIWRPILNYVEKETGYQFEIRGSQTIPNFENEFLQGEFDFAYMNPYHVMMANQGQGYIPIVRDVGKSLYGVLVVKKDSPITDVKQLDGKIIAFPAPNALGASLQMRQELYDHFKINILPRYVKTHDSVYLNVLLGEAVAGGGVQKTLNQQSKEYRDALRIIHTTKPVAPHPLVVHPRVSRDVAQAVSTALIKLGQTQEGKALLSQIPMKQIGETTMKDYEPLKAMGLERFYVKQF